MTSILIDELNIIPKDVVNLILLYSKDIVRHTYQLGHESCSINNKKYIKYNSAIYDTNFKLVYEISHITTNKKNRHAPNHCHLRSCILHGSVYFIYYTKYKLQYTLNIVNYKTLELKTHIISNGYNLLSINNKIFSIGRDFIRIYELSKELEIIDTIIMSTPNAHFSIAYRNYLIAIDNNNVLFYNENLKLIHTLSLDHILHDRLKFRCYIVESNELDLLIYMFDNILIRIKYTTNILDIDYNNISVSQATHIDLQNA